MGITGNLKTMQLAELLQWLSQSKKTGTLVIDDGEVEKKIFFEEGKVISSASSNPQEYLGQFLVSRGHITNEELTGAIQMQEKTGMLLGKILVSIGAIEEKEVHRLLQLKAEESIFDLFTWEEGSFEFLDGELPEMKMIPISLDVTGLVMEGARRVDEWSRIRGVVPSADAIPVTLVDDPADAEMFASEERRLLSAIDDRSTVDQVRERAHATEFFACRVLYKAVEAKKVKVIPAPWKGRAPGTSQGGRKAKEEVAGGEAAQETAAAAAPGTITAQMLLDAARPLLDAEDFEEGLRYLRAARELKPHDRSIKESVEAAQDTVRQALAAAGVEPSAVPTLTTGLEELTNSQLSRNEGFVLSRINGSYDIKSIMKISSLPELDALLAFWRLNKAGHVKLS